jgi:cytochrome c-type biogenesis protein
MLMDISFGGAAIAGILSFLSPCILPIVPFYLCYLGGISISALNNADELSSNIHWKLIISSIFFAFGVTTIFVLLGLGATFVGKLFLEWKQQLTYVSATILLLFGLNFLGILRIPLFFQRDYV